MGCTLGVGGAGKFVGMCTLGNGSHGSSSLGTLGVGWGLQAVAAWYASVLFLDSYIFTGLSWNMQRGLGWGLILGCTTRRSVA